MARSADIERWFERVRPPSEKAMRRVREIILSADPSVRERPQFGITFSSTTDGDFAAFVRYSEPGVNLRFHKGGRLHGRYPHLVGRGSVWRVRIADVAEANERAAELRAIVRECVRSERAHRAPKARPRG